MTQPDIVIAHNRDGTHYAIGGWDEFNRYARLNWPLWEAVSRATEYMSEVDRLKVLAYHHAVEAQHCRLMLEKYDLMSPKKVTIKPEDRST